jgi:UDP-N-acetylmuramate--alanine ligase
MKIHLIGAGGIGMSALAQLYLSEGHILSGSDRETSPTTELLEKKGMHISVPQDAQNVPHDAELVVYSDAVWEDNAERMRAKELGLRQVSYFEALGETTQGKTVVAVTGVHGKTTTTAFTAKALKDIGKNPSAVVGSIVPEFGSNFLQGDPNLFVIEGCEYRDHVLKLSPKVLVITNVEWDHTDWFPSLAAMQAMFKKAVQKLPTDGAVVVDLNQVNIESVIEGAPCRVIDYSKEEVPELHLPGEFNKMNARAAKAAVRALFPEASSSEIDSSLSDFKGTWRRFERKGMAENGALIYDDYAHHPTAIRETLKALRSKFPEKKITLVFHPHLYTRTRDLFNEFAEELGKADRIILVPIYPAREEPIPGVTSDALADLIRKKNPHAFALHSFEEIEQSLREDSGPDDLIMTIGAGDIYKVADNLVE